LLGAQDVYHEKNGAFTGEISVEMLKDVGVKFCLTGHSERRHIIGETPKLVSLKAHAVYRGGLILIHCVGEKIEQRDAGLATGPHLHYEVHVNGRAVDPLKYVLPENVVTD